MLNENAILFEFTIKCISLYVFRGNYKLTIKRNNVGYKYICMYIRTYTVRYLIVHIINK